MVKVLFVCLGNICRSPLAEGIFKKKLEERGLEEQVEVDSSGTSKYHIGEQPDERTLANALSNGLELNHEGRQFEKADFRKFDYIIAMDEANLNFIKRRDQAKEFHNKLMLMRHFDIEDKDADVPDPYFGGEDGFQLVYEILDRSTDEFLDKIVSDFNLKPEA